MALPKPGIHPSSSCEAARPTVEAAKDASAAAAALCVSWMPNTAPSETVMASWMGVMTALSLPGSCASPAPAAAAEADAVWMMAWHLLRWSAVMAAVLLL